MRRGLFSSFHFTKPLKFVLGLPNWEFLPERSIKFHAGKKIRKMIPPENIPLMPLGGFFQRLFKGIDGYRLANVGAFTHHTFP